MDGVPAEIGNATGDPIALAHHHSSHQGINEHKYSGMSAAERMDRERYYATVRKPMSQQQSPDSADLERIPEYSEDIYPYATFHLPDQGNLPGNQVMIGRHSGSSNISHPKFI